MHGYIDSMDSPAILLGLIVLFFTFAAIWCWIKVLQNRTDADRSDAKLITMTALGFTILWAFYRWMMR